MNIKNISLKQFIFIFLGIIIVAILIGFNFKSEKSSSSSVSQPKMNLEIRRNSFESGYSVPVITIKNLNDFVWQDCEIEMNDIYFKTLPAIELPSFFKELGSEKDYHIIATTWFLKKDGTKFNPEISQPVSICITCHKPYFDVQCGEFKN